MSQRSFGPAKPGAPELVASGLGFPEGPTVMPDGSLVNWDWTTVAQVAKLLTLDNTGLVLHYNRSAEDLLGLKLAQVRGRLDARQGETVRPARPQLVLRHRPVRPERAPPGFPRQRQLQRRQRQQLHRVRPHRPGDPDQLPLLQVHREGGRCYQDDHLWRGGHRPSCEGEAV